jgi:hypothetical protein
MQQDILWTILCQPDQDAKQTINQNSISDTHQGECHAKNKQQQ